MFKLLVVIFAFNSAFCANILAIFHFPCKSHHILGDVLLKGLARRGHHVTMVSPFPDKFPTENYTDIEITGMLDYKEKNIVPKFVTAHQVSMYDKMTFSIKNVREVAELFLEHPNVKELLSSSQKFDLVILNWSMNEALLGIAHHFKAPVIAFSTIGASRLTNKITRNPAPYSYTPNLFSTYSDEMTFIQRLSNTFWSVAFEIVDNYINEGIQEELLRKYFPNAPLLHDLIDNISLVFLNSHYAIGNAKPFLPNMIEIGGFHVPEVKNLDKGLKQFLDEASEGVVLFSLGTNLKSSNLPPEKLNEIVKTFRSLNVKVLWKFEEHFKDLPNNVRVDEWLPQTDVLAHPNVKAFVTHGGRLSTIEALYHEVPIIGIPFFSDQEYNVAESVNGNWGIKVDFLTLTKKTLSEAIEEVLNNPKYMENARKRSKILKDQPLKQLDTAIFWVEHVLRHRGAPHLQTAALKLSWWQYLLLDVTGFVIGVVISLLSGSCLAIVWSYRILRRNCCTGAKIKDN